MQIPKLRCLFKDCFFGSFILQLKPGGHKRERECLKGRFRPWIAILLVLGGVGAVLGFGSVGCFLATVWLWSTFRSKEAAPKGDAPGKRAADDDLSTESEIDPDAASGL